MSNTAVPTSILAIDLICDEFESNWKEGLRPLLEDFVYRFEPKLRRPLFLALLELDVDYRHRCKESPSSGEYIERFPEYAVEIETAFSRESGNRFPEIQYWHFARLRKAVEKDLITDAIAERLIRATPINHSLLDTVKSNGDLSVIEIEQLSNVLDESRMLSGASEISHPDHSIKEEETQELDRIEYLNEDADSGRQEYAGLPLRYELIGKPISGGMGHVFRAFDNNLRRVVAIKVLPTHDSAAAQAMQQECMILAKLNHPGIVSVYDSGNLCDGRPFIVMEYVEGMTLDKVQFGRNHYELLELFEECCRAIAVAHYLQIVHRDLKPSNIMLGADGKPKILDFGLAKLLDTESLSETHRVGTMIYASPEQVLGEHTDARSDVYALGVMLYEALTGTTPAQILPTMPAIAIANAKRNVEPLRVRAPRICLGIEAIVHKCLSVEPSDRYADAAALADEISNYLRSRPLSAVVKKYPQYWAIRTFSVGSAPFVFALLICVISLVTVIARFPATTFLASLAVSVGLQGGTVLVQEAQMPLRSSRAKISCYLAGFILWFEAVLVIAALGMP